MRSLLIPLLWAGLSATALSAQSGILDQSCPFDNASFNAGTNVLTWQAEVACGLSGKLNGFELEIYGSAGATVDVAVKVGAGWNVGAAAWSGTLTAAGTGFYERVYADASSANIQLNAGDLFVIEIVGNTGMNVRGQYIAPPGTPPYPEELYLNGPGCFADCGWRIGFNTWMEPGGGGPALAKSGTCPGPMTLTVTGATPSGSVAMLHGFPGSFTKQNGTCAGLTIPINQPTLGVVLQANANGVATVSFNAPPGLCGRTIIGVDISSCTATNTLTL